MHRCSICCRRNKLLTTITITAFWDLTADTSHSYLFYLVPLFNNQLTEWAHGLMASARGGQQICYPNSPPFDSKQQQHLLKIMIDGGFNGTFSKNSLYCAFICWKSEWVTEQFLSWNQDKIKECLNMFGQTGAPYTLGTPTHVCQKNFDVKVAY